MLPTAGPETKEAIDELLKIPNLTYITGNHDVWALQWMETREAAETWLDQGGRATCDSYKDKIPASHVTFLKEARDFVVENNTLFVHAGILPGLKAEECSHEILFWDRTLVRMAMDLTKKGTPRQLTPYDEVFVGHTPISASHPTRFCESVDGRYRRGMVGRAFDDGHSFERMVYERRRARDYIRVLKEGDNLRSLWILVRMN